ncbi:T9SS type A sorting domain-containing protein, partial [Flavobacteriales bacterium]|nr:T9SS type A sorting domain-containing protein [Flavobacteriales bacterium]
YVVDMQDSYGDGWNGASIDVSVNGSTVANMTCSGSGSIDSIATLNGDVVEFSFNSGSWDGEITFQITDPSGAALGSYGPNPAVGVFLTNTSNATCVPTTVNVTFQVDMGLVTSAFTTPEVNGTWNSWCGNCNPMTDADGDGVWEATIPLLSGNYEYKYSADAWTIQEMNDPTASCTNGDPVYTNRVLSVGTSDMTISTVCWGSCSACVYPPQAAVGVNCAGNGNPGLVFTDEIDPTTGWSGDIGTGNGYWRINSGGTTSSGTGPTAAHSGADYLFFETSTGGLDTATAITPAIDLTAGGTDAELSFWMHAHGSGIGTLRVGASTSATGPFTELYSWSGQYQANQTDPYYQVGVNMASYVGQMVYVSFTYERGTSGVSYQGDIAIDLIQANTCLNCVAPSALTTSNVTGTSADVSWTAGGTETEWFLIVNGAGTSQTSTTASLTGLTPNTAYTYQVHAICAVGDTSAASPASSFTTSCTASVAPTNETFDAGFSNCWSQETTDSLDWLVGSGGTPSGGTGPSDDFTGGGNYMYIETSVPVAHGDVATMYSEVIDISGLTNPELRFLNHMYGSAMGTMDVDLWDASTGTVVGNVFTHTGDRGNQWNEELIMLSTTATLVQFSITATVDTNATGQAWTGDMAIDEFGVREAAANDLALVAAAVASGCDLTATEPIELWVVNQGLVAESAFDLSYAVNGGTPVVESITSTVNPGDTLKYVFTATADMTADGVYNLDFACVLSTDNDLADNALSMMAENYDTPMAPVTMGDTICNGDTAMVSADEYSYWYDAATGGNLVGEGDEIDVMPTATTSYYAEAAATAGHFEDFDSYNVGDYIVASDPSNWAVWPGGTPGGAYDMQIDDAQGNGGNSLRVDNADGTDVVLEFGEAFSSGYFYYSMDMYIVGDGYINFQEQVTIGAAWNMSITMIGGVLNVDVDGASVLTGAYSTTPTGGPVWNTFEFECDYSTGTWEVFVNGTSQGTFVNADPVASVNIYPGAGVNYYLDNVEWGALKDDACRSASRTEAVVTVEDCSNILELAKGDLDVYPNPNNGSFTVENSVDIVKLTITDVHGKIVQSINEINLNKVDVDLTDLEKGMYMI